MFRVVRGVLITGCLIIGHSAAIAGAYEDILIAAENGQTIVVTDLLARGMDVNTADGEGSTLLLIAARADNQALVEFLIKRRASVSKRNRAGDTALHVAALNGYAPIVGVLLASGAEVNFPGWTPLHYAAYAGHLQIVQALMAKAAKLDVRAPNGRTALMLAAQNSQREVIAALIKGGADPMLADNDGKSYVAILEGATAQQAFQK